MMSHDVTVHVTSMSLHTHSNAWRFRVPDRMHYWDVYCISVIAAEISNANIAISINNHKKKLPIDAKL